MRCSYCYNPEIVFGKGKISISEALTFIKSRKGLLDGVVLSGGECTLHKEIILLAEEIKKNNFLLKIDTNGSQPSRIQELLDRKLVDYVSLDYKALPHKFEAITKSQFYDEFNQSLKLLQNSDVEFEVRTTVHSELFSEFELIAMTKHLVALGYKGKYYLQNFVNDTPIIGNIEKRHRELRAFPFSQNNLEVIIRI